MKPRNNPWLFLVMLITSGPFLVYANKNNEQPINITSVEASYDPKTETGVYKENVVMTQGSLEIKADITTFYMKSSELDYLEAKATPIKIKFLPEGKSEWVYGEALSLKYYPHKNLLILEGGSKITQLNDIITANKIEYNTVTEVVSAYGTKKNQVHMTIQPRKGKS